MTNLEQVQRKAQTLKEAFEKVQNNQFYWQKKTKPFLESTLQAIQMGTALSWTVQQADNELIRLVLTDEVGLEIAALSFQLMYNSLVTVGVSYQSKTYYPEAKSETRSMLYIVEPSKVNEDLIHTSVAQFIDILLEEYITKPNAYVDVRTRPSQRFVRISKPDK